MATSTIRTTSTPIINEGTALLAGRPHDANVDSNFDDDVDGAGEDEDWPYQLYRLSSEVIERTGVLFQPDFSVDDDDYDDGDGNDNGNGNGNGGASHSSSRTTSTRNSITFSTATIRGSSRGSTSLSTKTSSSSISGSSNSQNTGAMIGTITTTSILNLVVATGACIIACACFVGMKIKMQSCTV